jgi:hypothetical protein
MVTKQVQESKKYRKYKGLRGNVHFPSGPQLKMRLVNENLRGVFVFGDVHDVV